MKYFLLLFVLVGQAYAQVTLQNLRTDYQTTPLGIDVTNPQFSWQMKATGRDFAQTAYQIVVIDEKNQSVWDTKKVNSDISHAIAYAGSALKPTTRYTWKVSVWDNKGKTSIASSWFETGLMNTNISGWSGAKQDVAQWIGGGDADMVLYSHYLGVFKFQYGLKLPAGSTKASFVFGANDSRLMNKNLNLMNVQNAQNESYIALELDISTVSGSPEGLAKLNVYRVNYTKTDKADVPLTTLTVPQNIINQSNKNDKHTIYLESVFGVASAFIDGEDDAHRLKESASDAPNSPFGARGFNLNPMGRGHDYISFPMLADIGFKTADGQKAFFSDIVIKNLRSPSNALFTDNPQKSIFGNKMSIENGQYAVSGNTLVTGNPTQNAAPMLRGTFTTEAKKIAKARLYVTAKGIYEMYLNGNRIGNDYFNPGMTQYNKRLMYQTYDLTTAIKSGQKNAIGAWLSEGWWSGNITYEGRHWNFFGDRQSLLSKLVITYADGSEQVVTTNPTDWKMFTDGPVRYGSFFQGEVYDANKEAAIKDWSTATYDDSKWKPTVEVPMEGTTYLDSSTDFQGNKSTIDYKDFKIVSQMGNNASIVKTLTALSVEEVRPKVFVYDMGQNMVGFPQITIKNGKKGQVVAMRYAEMRYPNLADYKGNEGMVMMENIRAALTQDLYILKGGDEVIQPRFTFHGYRYLEITGIDQAIPATDVKGLVISSIKELSSSYETSNALVNKLWQNITWSLRSNFLSIPTDTPARNERMGWSGDISVFAKSATYLTDADLFLRKHMTTMRDIQNDNGRFTDTAPIDGGFGGTLWGSAGITVAWETYRQYGDVQLLREHFTAMKRYVDYLDADTKKNNGILTVGPLGDWLSPEGNQNDNTLFWMAYFYHDLGIVSQAAAILGNTDDAAKYAKRQAEVKALYNEVYVDKNTHKSIKSGVKTPFIGAPNEKDARQKNEKGLVMDTQASYAIPLALGVFNDENKPFATKYLAETIQRKNIDDSGAERPEYSLLTGFIGTASISEALSENGKNEVAYRLLQAKHYPSWLYSVVNGATSIWERLNSYTVENGFGGNNSMNSFNHYSFGAVASWMYNYSLGIQRHPQKAGFKEFILKPTPDPDKKMTSAKGHYDSVYGRIESEWKIEANKWTYKATVPANTTATLYLPTTDVSKIKESGKAINAKTANGYAVIILKSGTYGFEIKD